MKNIIKILVITISLVSFSFGGLAYSDAAQASSSNYQVSEVFLGSGGSLNACSTSYCTKESAGELTVGNTSSANYQAQTGFNSNRDPFIQMLVSNTNTNLGVLRTNSTATATSTFSVETYLAHGYQVVNASPPPSNGTHTMSTPSSPTTSQLGSEQFGINLVANTAPASFGANPTYSPNNTFSFGIVDSSYSTPNYYMYSQGSTVALSTASTSYTNYTISYIFNISTLTPSGNYNFNHVLVATSTY
jgi:hypothetical protein